MRRLVLKLIGCLFVILFALPTQSISAGEVTKPDDSNYITITEEDGAQTHDHLVHLARPFVQGEIRNLPVAVVSGKEIETQANVFSRWPDGSVRHASLTFYVTLQPRDSVRVTFRNEDKGNQVKGNKGSGLTTKQMLDPRFGFDAVIQLAFSNGTTHSLSAREMLSNEDYTPLLEGPLATSIYLGDHGAKAYDVGAQRANPTSLVEALPGAPDPDPCVIKVQDATGWTAPMLVQVKGRWMPEDVLVSSVRTDLSPHELGVCDGEGASGRHYNRTNLSHYPHEAGSSVYPDIWSATDDPTLHSFRPIFIATFFPRDNRVKVEAVGEITDTEKLQDLIYDLRVTGAAKNSVQVYPSDGSYSNHVVHRGGTRWVKRFWIGGEPSRISINHNLGYLTRTKLIPNFDPGISVSEHTIDWTYRSGPGAWLTFPHDLFQEGTLTKAMGNVGGREDIGLVPVWGVRWLYTGDYRALEQTIGNADLGNAWPMNFREGNATKKYDREGKIDALGMAAPNLYARPTNASVFGGIDEQDIMRPVGLVTHGDWVPSSAHLPDLCSALWMLTGDHVCLEQMIFWATYEAVSVTNPHPGVYYGRTYSTTPDGRTFGLGNIYGQVRGDAWVLNHRAITASLIPTYYPEAAYIDGLVHDALAVWEGVRDITGTRYEGTTAWNWGHTTGMGRWQGHGVPPLKFWDYNPGLAVQFPIGKASAGEPPWMMHFVISALGRARELGYPTDALLAWAGSNLIARLTHPDDIDPYYVAAYQIPTAARNGQWFQTWSEVRDAYLPSGPGACVYPETSCYSPSGWFWYYTGWGADAYPYIAYGATSMVYHLPGGEAAWQWISDQLSGETPRSRFSVNPQWKILPRDPDTPAPEGPSQSRPKGK